jgi:hypothetical protein
MRWKQQITDRIFRLNGLLLLLRDFGAAKVREIDEATHCLIDDAFLAGFRPGHVVRRLDAHIEELGQIADREARKLRRRYDRLHAHLQQRPSEDAERALARANRFLPTRDGLPTVKRFLDIADRALVQAIGDEDLRALSDSGALDLRRVRPRADFPARILRPTDALQWLREEAKNLPSDFDREKVAEPFRELSPIEGRIRTEPAAQRRGFSASAPSGRPHGQALERPWLRRSSFRGFRRSERR